LELANWNKIKAKRFELNVEGYTETDGEEPYFLTPYFGVLPENVDNKAKSKLKKNSLHQAYYVEQPAFSTVPAHFHDTNQFQVFLDGKAVFGKKPINSVTVHYAGGHTPYGPIITENSAIKYLTLRNKWDSGGKKMPEERKNLVDVSRVFYLSDKLNVDNKIKKNVTETEIDTILWEETSMLGIAIFYIPHSKECNFAFPKMGYGKYCLVLSGSLLHNSNKIKPLSCLYLEKDELVDLKSGDDGAVVLSMQFPIEPI
tara:strand:+ start:68 stop:838 length:771 start_codon:yes stop_codon:yes gene_type:complete